MFSFFAVLKWACLLIDPVLQNTPMLPLDLGQKKSKIIKKNNSRSNTLKYTLLLCPFSILKAKSHDKFPQTTPPWPAVHSPSFQVKLSKGQSVSQTKRRWSGLRRAGDENTWLHSHRQTRTVVAAKQAFSTSKHEQTTAVLSLTLLKAGVGFRFGSSRVQWHQRPRIWHLVTPCVPLLARETQLRGWGQETSPTQQIQENWSCTRLI